MSTDPNKTPAGDRQPQVPPAGSQAPVSRTTGRDSLSFPEKHGAWILAAGGAVAWALAVAETSDPVATAFAVAGFLLIAAAAFYSRVQRVGRDGLELRDHLEAAADVVDGTAEEDGDTTADIKARAVRNLHQLAALTTAKENSGLPTPRSERPSVRQALMERDRIEANVRSFFVGWLQRQQFTVVEEHADRDGIRTDMVAERAKDGETAERLLIDIRPAVAVLRRGDAASILARTADDHDAPAKLALVLRSDAIVLPDAEKLLFDDGARLFAVDPDGGTVVERFEA